jgi:hypothetical protein
MGSTGTSATVIKTSLPEPRRSRSAVAADRSLRTGGKARNVKLLLRTSVAAFVMFAGAHWGARSFLSAPVTTYHLD